MKADLANIIPKRPYYLLLLPVFFVLHGFRENYSIVFAKDALILAGWYLLASFVLFGIFYLVSRNLDKAALMAFTVMAFNFFFGALHDLFKKIDALPFLSRYVFILPFSLILIISILILIRRSKHKFRRLNKYLNTLFVFLIVIDSILLFSLAAGKDRSITTDQTLNPCSDCTRPDIYLIVTDSYPSNILLKETLGFDNSAFENALRERGFYIADSAQSNYNMTVTSIASMLNMNFVDGIDGSFAKYHEDMATAYRVIRNCQVVDYMRSNGYKIYNHSIFDLRNAPTVTRPTFLPDRTSSITSQTFINRIVTDLGFHLIDDLKLKFVIEMTYNTSLRNDEKLMAKTRKIATEKEVGPKFIYTHFMMPHYPYYYDSAGNKSPVMKIDDTHIKNAGAFIEYLKYANTQYLSLIDHIRNASVTEPIIILIGDHGYRHFNDPVSTDYHFKNLFAVSLPGENYQGFYKKMTNVNLFRVIFNTQFRQKLPLLSDSSRLLYHQAF